MNYDIDKVEHLWDESNDRWIYLEFNKQRKIIGMNFMQGNEYHCFKNDWCKSDEGLTEFYNQMLYTFPIEKASVSTLSFINKCMWTFHTAIATREQNPQ